MSQHPRRKAARTKIGQKAAPRRVNKQLKRQSALREGDGDSIRAEEAQAGYKTGPQSGSKNEQREISEIANVARENREAQPFLKWVGGKAQLLAQFERFFPSKIDGYFEPFIGGGAVFFHLKHRFPQMRAHLRDINDELINTYKAVRDFPEELMRRLDEHLENYRPDRERYYYVVRSQHHLPAAQTVERAARMIFLNKTCFNGLWRVNGRGEFNVPIGSHKNPSLYDAANIRAASRALQGVELATQDFRDTLNETQRGDFAYVDPPYVPVSLTANFTSYAKEDFGIEEQRELAALAAAAARRGVRLMLSNSDMPFVRELYNDFTIHPVQARRAINSDGAKRGAVGEVLVCAGE